MSCTGINGGAIVATGGLVMARVVVRATQSLLLTLVFEVSERGKGKWH